MGAAGLTRRIKARDMEPGLLLGLGLRLELGSPLGLLGLPPNCSDGFSIGLQLGHSDRLKLGYRLGPPEGIELGSRLGPPEVNQDSYSKRVARRCSTISHESDAMVDVNASNL